MYCTCEGVKELSSYFQMEYVMLFLMGLNDSYAQIRSQLLIFDPIPQINKAFSLISQGNDKEPSVLSKLLGETILLMT